MTFDDVNDFEFDDGVNPPIKATDAPAPVPANPRARTEAEVTAQKKEVGGMALLAGGIVVAAVILLVAALVTSRPAASQPQPVYMPAPQQQGR